MYVDLMKLVSPFSLSYHYSGISRSEKAHQLNGSTYFLSGVVPVCTFFIAFSYFSMLAPTR